MTSALKGVGGPEKADEVSKGGCVGEGVKKSDNFADVIYGSSLNHFQGLKVTGERWKRVLSSHTRFSSSKINPARLRKKTVRKNELF